jgi:Protein of unknown function (DUF3618)
MTDAAGPVPEVIDPAPQPAAYDANKRPADIEEDIARTRAELSETLDALERKLAPRQLLEKGVDMLRDSMDGNFGKVGETLRANPIPLALIAGGLGWFLLSRTGGARAVGDVARSSGDALGTAARRMGDVASDAAHRVKEMIGAETPADPSRDNYAYARPKPGERIVADAAGTVSDVAGKAREALEAAGERASAYAGSLGENFDRARSRFSQLMDEHPMAIGVMGFLAGAVLAVALPSTRLGNATLGPARDRLLDEAKERGREVIERVRRTAEAVADTASAEAEKAGATDEAKPAPEASGPGTEPAGAS